MATSSLAQKDLDEAATHFDRAVVANPRYVPALVGRGEALLGLGERERPSRASKLPSSPTRGWRGLRSRIEVLRVRGLQDDVAAARKATEAGRLDEARRLYDQAHCRVARQPFLYRESR